MSRPDEPTFVPAFDAVEQISREYLDRAQNDSPPSMVEFLGKAREGVQPVLLRNLLQVDIERRRQRGDLPAADDYLRWFPEHEALIRHEFLESVSVIRATHPSLLDSTTCSGLEKIVTPTATRLGDYHLVAELGRGAMGIVMEAVHGQRHDRVALKILPEVHGDSLHRFKREFRSLADINHPNLIGLHTLECDGDQWFFTMDLVDGTDFVSYVRPDGKLDENRLRSSLAQLVSGVMALHSNFVIHRDLKPSNVIVDREGRVQLLDFGLVLEQQHALLAETVNGIAGTPAYMAPEQAMGEAVTAACDWYAVGVMLYESLTGRRPFGGTILKVLQDKQHEDPRPLPDNAGLPNDLCQLCMDLIARDPSERPDTMSVMRTVSSASANTCAGTPSPAHADVLIGRQDQMRELQASLDAFIRGGQPMAVFVNGRSGEGKTTLCEAFLEPLRKDSHFAVMSGRCYDRESVPFKALDSTIDAVCGYLKGLPDHKAAAMLPRDVSMLSHIFPVLGRVKAVAAQTITKIDNLNEQEIRNRGFLALRELLGRIGDQHPIILFVDDLQWGDADSAEVLLQIFQPPNAPQVFLLGAYRTDEADDSRFLQTWETVKDRRALKVERKDVRVGPLSQEECTQLVIEMLHQDNEAIRGRSREFFEQTGGNAFLLTELIGCFDPQSDSFRPIPVQQVIEEKLNRLPSEARRILELISVSGQSLKTEEASWASGHPVTPMATMNRMRSERLIRFLGEEMDGDVDTYHDRIRETVLAGLNPTDEQQLHRNLGEVIEQREGGLTDAQITQLEQGIFDIAEQAVSMRLFDLSFHFDEAAILRKALAYSFLAAEQARKQLSLEIAATQYRVAWRNFEHCGEGTRYRILVGLGDTLRLLGEYREADEILAEAHKWATDLLDRCEVENLRAELARGEGRYADSAQQYARTLRSLGVRVPQAPVAIGAALFREVLVQAGHTIVGFPRRGSVSADRRNVLISRLLSGLTMSVWFRNTPLVLWGSLVSLNRSEVWRTSTELIHAQGLHGLICAVAGLSSRSERYLDHAVSNTSDDDLASQLLNAFHRMGSAFASCRFEACQEECGRGLKLVERTGNIWRALILRLHIILSDYRLGNLAVALEATLDAFSESVRLGDPNTAHDHINVVAMLTKGRFNYEGMQANLVAIPDNYQATNQKLQAQAWWHLYHGRTGEGLDVAQQAFDLMKKHVVVNHITTPNFPLLLEAIRAHAKTLQSTDPAETEKLLKRGYRLAKWGVRLTNNGPDSPATLRELGRYQAQRGKIRKALKTTEKSCRVAEGQKAAFELALSRLACTEYRMQLGQATATDLSDADALVSEFTAPIETLCQEHPLLIR